MLRKALKDRGPEEVNGFRMRGTEVGRLECFSDCVFGFALTLLVVSLEVPKAFDDLMNAVRGFVAFAFCFIILFSVWNRHFDFCRRYGMEDENTRVLTGLLLFVVLGYVYPLKFLTLLFVNFVLGVDVGSFKHALRGVDQLRSLFILYGCGYAAVNFVFLLLYGNALRMRQKLDLSPLELLDTRSIIFEHWGMLGVPALSILVATFAPAQMVGFAGYIYFLLGFVGWGFGTAHRKRRNAFIAADPDLIPAKT